MACSTVVVCTSGVDLEVVPFAVDAVAAHAGAAAGGCLIVVPARDVIDIQRRLAALVVVPTRSPGSDRAVLAGRSLTPVFERLAGIEDEYASSRRASPTPRSSADQRRLRQVSKRYKDLTPLVEALRAHRARVADVDDGAPAAERRRPATTGSCGATSWPLRSRTSRGWRTRSAC